MGWAIATWRMALEGIQKVTLNSEAGGTAGDAILKAIKEVMTSLTLNLLDMQDFQNEEMGVELMPLFGWIDV